MIQFFLKRKILIGLASILILLVGSYSLLKLDKELLPAVNFDGAYVEVLAGEISAVEVERTITNPLEQRIKSIEGVEEIKSTTSAGRSSLQVTIESGKGEEVTKEIQSVAYTATSEVPSIDDITVNQIGTSQSYEFYMDVSNGDLDEITSFAKEILEPRLEKLKAVRDVQLSGTQEYEIVVNFDRQQLVEKGLDVTQISSIIQEANHESTLAILKEEKGAPAIRWNTKIQTTDELKKLKIPSETGVLTLEDLAEITIEPQKSASFVWKNGTKDFIFVQIGRAADVSQIEMAKAVRNEVQNIRNEGLVKNFELNEMVAQADYVQESIDGVSNNIWIGGIIAIVILLMFLRNIRATIIVGIAIPTSILLTFLAIWQLDYSLNILTLIGLGLGVGMMVDSSIVILESIFRKKEQGLQASEAVIEGTKEVATAVIASMLTTIVVFLPIGLLGGEMGQFMILLSAVVAVTLISSVLVSFTLIPSLAERFLKLNKEKIRKEGPVVKGYSNLIWWVIKKKRNSFAAIILFSLMFVGALLLLPRIPMTIMPDVYNRYSELMVELEKGLPPEDKEQIVKEIDKSLSKVEDVETNYVIDNGGMLYTIINMTKGENITREQKDVNEDILSTLRDLQDTYPIAGIYSAMSAGGGYPVQVTISGEEFKELQVIAEEFVQELKGVEGIVAVTNSIERSSIERIVKLKEKEIENAGLLPSQVKSYIEQSFLDMHIGDIALHGINTPVRITWNEEISSGKELLSQTIPTSDGKERVLSSFVEIFNVDTPNEINHLDGLRYVTVSADIKGSDLGTVNRKISELIKNLDTPKGYTISPAGDLEEQQQLIEEMILILALSIFLVFLVMAVQFNHLIYPLIVMSIIPMTLVGVILGLLLTQRELSIMSGMGIVLLIGIVINNAILLIDRTIQLRNEGFNENESIIEAGKNRIRPIFMTTLTTAGGMAPLALAGGASGNYQAPMATVIISGLLFATLITLILIPAVYRIFNGMGRGVKQIINYRKNKSKYKKEYAS